MNTLISRLESEEEFCRKITVQPRLAESFRLAINALQSETGATPNDLDWERLRSGQYRALNPDNQPLFDEFFGRKAAELAAAGPAPVSDKWCGNRSPWGGECIIGCTEFCKYPEQSAPSAPSAIQATSETPRVIALLQKQNAEQRALQQETSDWDQDAATEARGPLDGKHTAELIALASQLERELAKAQRSASEPIKYGCHCDIENMPDGYEPDACVFDEGDIESCVHAQNLSRSGKGKTDCEYWKPITVRRSDSGAKHG